MNVVNDHAERGVSLTEEYSNSITKNEDQLQFLLQVVQEHRKAFPNSKKCTLTRNWVGLYMQDLKSIELPLNVQINGWYFARSVFIAKGTLLEGEKKKNE